MISLFCDRCGTLVYKGNRASDLNSTMWVKDIVQDDDGPKFVKLGKYDLCANCRADLRNWLRGGRK